MKAVLWSSTLLLLVTMRQHVTARSSIGTAFNFLCGKPASTSSFHHSRPLCGKILQTVVWRVPNRCILSPMLRMKSTVSTEELTPGSDQMKARAKVAMGRMGKQLLTPLEAANILAGDKNELLSGNVAHDDDALFIDVRTPQQRLDHEVMPGVKGLTAMGADNIPLDDMIKMEEKELQRLLGISPNGGGRKVVLTCTAGPKSCVTWDYLTENVPGVNCDNLFVIDGGIKAWAGLGFPTEPVKNE